MGTHSASTLLATPLIMTSPSTLACRLPVPLPSLPRRNEDACELGASRIEIASAPTTLETPAFVDDVYVGGSIHVELMVDEDGRNSGFQSAG
jgi:hypothetical protein